MDLINNSNLRCPECQSSVVAERDCPECDGLGHDEYGNENICGACEGVGAIRGEWECLECSHEWDE